MIAMAQSIPIINGGHSCNTAPSKIPGLVLWLQGITLTWMLLECVVSLYAAKTAHSAALLAFGSDSVVELLSASVALASFIPSFPLTKDRAARWAGILLFVLAAVVAFTAILALARDNQPETSRAGIGITTAALVVMPSLAWFKRKVARTTGNHALAADAIQSATCAYLAAVTLVGLAANAIFQIHWIDPLAAFMAVPILVVEGRKATRGETCGCC
jgi:divalent metal cation (Fe/Co/Zn/Cd) transporter